ncbi:MAG: hypothetical protein WBO54_03690 [Thermoanaerobaculia bacterium]
MYSVTKRPATQEEVRALVRIANEASSTLRFLMVFTAVLMLLFGGCGVVVSLAKGFLLQRLVIGSLMGLLLGGSLTASFWWYIRSSMPEADQPASDSVVEDVVVRCSEAVELVPVLGDADDPSVCIDLGSDALLLLRGQWLMDQSLFGGTGVQEPAESFNSLPEPHSFPKTEFVLTRDPRTGSVLGILATGKYLAPRPSAESLNPQLPLADSLIIPGSTDTLSYDLAAYYRTQQPSS